MTSNTRTTASDGPPGPHGPPIAPTVEARATEARSLLTEIVDRLGDGEAADPLALLESLTSLIDQAQAAATHATRRAQTASAAETVEGLSLQRFLTAVCRRPYGDAATLLTVGEVLADMPQLRGLLDDGAVAFGTVRKIVYRLHRNRQADRQIIDNAIGDAADRLADMDPDELVAEVSTAVDRLRGELAEQREQRAADREFVALQPRLDGTGGSLYAEYGPVNFELVARHLNHLATRHRRQDSSGGGETLTLAQARARALVDLCTTRRTGDGSSDGDGLPAPDVQLTVLVDIDHLAQLQRVEASALGPWGRLVTHASAQPVQLTRRTLDRLRDGDPTVCTVFRDGAELLGIARPTTYIPETLRTAVLARDGHDRAPGSAMPAKACDLDHITPRSHGGTTELHNLVTLNREAHNGKDAGGPWQLTMTADGTATWTNPNTGRVLRSLPRLRRKLSLPTEPDLPKPRPELPRNRGDP